MTLEEILQRWFGCKKPFLKEPKLVAVYSDGEKEYEYFTKSGGKAYSEFVELLYALGEMDVGIDAKSVDFAVTTFDSIISEHQY